MILANTFLVRKQNKRKNAKSAGKYYVNTAELRVKKRHTDFVILRSR